MALIDSSYFIGTLNIPNVDKTYVRERLEWFINVYQDQLLRNVLGYELYKIFEQETSGYDPDASGSDLIAERWEKLIAGAEFTKNNKLRKWRGLLFEQGGEQRSPIANYVYYYWMDKNNTQTTGVGEAKSKTENAELENPVYKMTDAWNEMSNWLFELFEYLDASKETYPEWKSADSTWIRRQFGHQNSWGI